jgi:hypothetical protein
MACDDRRPAETYLSALPWNKKTTYLKKIMKGRLFRSVHYSLDRWLVADQFSPFTEWGNCCCMVLVWNAIKYKSVLAKAVSEFIYRLELKKFTEQVGSSGNVSDLYSGGVWFESRPGHPLSWLKFFLVFSFPLGKYRESALT